VPHLLPPPFIAEILTEKEGSEQKAIEGELVPGTNATIFNNEIERAIVIVPTQQYTILERGRVTKREQRVLMQQ
jgi:hypothetical protein